MSEQPHALCGAKTRSGKPCKNHGMANGRCRMHGGKSTGAPMGNKNAFKHGRYSRDGKQEQREMRMLLKSFRQSLKEMN